MSKVVGPLLSLSARGKFAKAMVFQGGKSKTIVTRPHHPGSVTPYTPPQAVLDQRAKITSLVSQWQALSANEKAVWNATAESAGYHGSGYNYYIAHASVVSGTWTVQYEADVIPTAATPPWTKGGETTTEEILGGDILHIIAGVAFVQYEIYPTEVVDVTIELRVKLISTFLCLDFSNAAGIYYYIEIFPASVVLWDADGIESDVYLMDTTDDYHTYRFTLDGGIARVYIDGVLRLTVNNPIVSGSDYLSFSNNEGDEFNMDYLYYRTDGAFPP